MLSPHCNAEANVHSSGASVAIATVMELDSLHRRIETLNKDRFAPGFPDVDLEGELAREHELRFLEDEAIERERSVVCARVAHVPTDAPGFLRWFESLETVGPGQRDALFPWLASQASLDQMRWFLHQELVAAGAIDDVMALVQVHMPERAKLELARNVWDELGRGQPGAMRRHMRARLARALHLDGPDVPVVWEAAAVTNLMTGLAATRRYAFHAIGALGVAELTGSGRAAQVLAGLKRLGVGPDARQYYADHASVDKAHARTWMREVIEPLVASSPKVARAIAEGAMMRLEVGRRCFDRYRKEMGVRAVAPIQLRRPALGTPPTGLPPVAKPATGAGCTPPRDVLQTPR